MSTENYDVSPYVISQNAPQLYPSQTQISMSS